MSSAYSAVRIQGLVGRSWQNRMNLRDSGRDGDRVRQVVSDPDLEGPTMEVGYDNTN